MGLARSKVGLRRASICLTSWYFTRTNPQCVWDWDLGQVYGVEMDMKISPIENQILHSPVIESWPIDSFIWLKINGHNKSVKHFSKSETA